MFRLLHGGQIHLIYVYFINQTEFMDVGWVGGDAVDYSRRCIITGGVTIINFIIIFIFNIDIA